MFHSPCSSARVLCRPLTAAFALLLCVSWDARAEDGQPTPTPVPDLQKIVRVTEVINADYVNLDEEEKNETDWFNKGVLAKREAGLGDRVVIYVRNLEALLLRSKCEPPFDKPEPCKSQDISLYINGRIIKGLKPESGAPELTGPSEPDKNNWVCGDAEHPRECRGGTLKYHLQRLTDEENREDNQEHWADLLGLPPDLGRWSLVRRVDVSVGQPDAYPVSTDVNDSAPKDLRFFLIRLRPQRAPFWLLFFVGLGWGLYKLSKRYDLLCDRTPVVWPRKRPYSLSLVQAAWWFLIIAVAFVFIWLVTGQSNFSETALALLGIGAGTALGATVIDSNKRARDTSGDASAGSPEDLRLLLGQKQLLEDDLNRLSKDLDDSKRRLLRLQRQRSRAEQNKTDTAKIDDEIKAKQADIGRLPTELKAKKDEYDRKVNEIKTDFPNAFGPPRESFLLDILSDAGGVSFHRFQMLVWSVVLGIFFMVSALGVLAMPNFSATLLGLMGLSAGTYLGFKIPENTGGGADTQTGGGGGGGQGGGGGGQGGAAPAINPDSGSESGGTSVTIANTGFADVKSVTFGGAPATEVKFDNATSAVTAVTPPHPAGKVEVVVINQAGKSVVLSYTYTPPADSGDAGGGG